MKKLQRSGIRGRHGHLLMAVALAGSGCSQILGLNDYGVSTHTVDSGGASGPKRFHGVEFANASCGECLDRDCGRILDSCTAEPSCAGFLACDAACSRDTIDCSSLCMGLWGVRLRSHEPWDVLQCRANHCSAECGLPCNGTCLGNLTCDKCLSDSCSDQGTGLAKSTEALRMLTCEASTAQLDIPVISGGCEAANPDAGDAWSAWSSCRTGACSNDCAEATTTPDWSCLDKIPARSVFPGPKTEFDAFVYNVGTHTGFSGALVRACEFPFYNCPASSKTNGLGLATLQAVATSRYGLFDFLEITAPGIIEPLIYAVFPQVDQGGVRILAPVLTKATMAGYYAAAGSTWDPNFAMVIISVFSCGVDFTAPGVSFESNDLQGGQKFYLTPQVASSKLLPETSTNGTGGFVNLPTGTGPFRVGTFTARRVARDGGPGQFVASAQLIVKPGTVTWATLAPSPSGGW